jgi:urease accessory protein
MEILAHIGLGTNGFWTGLLHPLTGVDHLLAMLAFGILAAVVADRRIAWVTPGAFVGGMVIGGVLGIAGVGSGSVETAIAVSIAVPGALIAATLVPSFRLSVWVPAIALAVGAIHGIAHGSEVPGSAHPALYVAGFVAATICLHLSGVFVGTTVGRNAAVRAGIAGFLSIAGVAILAGLPI